MARHVIVETNWVVDLVAPLTSRNPGAAELMARAQRGELTLHVPSISLSEAHKVVRARSVRTDLENVRAFVRERREAGALDPSAAEVAFRVLEEFQMHAEKERREARTQIASLVENPAIDVFHLSEAMLERSTDIAAKTGLELQSFDLSILAAVTVKGRALCNEGHDVAFCTLDADLQPWDRRGNPKPELAAQFNAAGVWVYGDFLLSTPPRPDPWP